MSECQLGLHQPTDGRTPDGRPAIVCKRCGCIISLSIRDAARVEDVAYMLATGDHPARAARRVDLTPAGASKMLRRAGRRDLARHFDREVRA